MSAPKLGLAAMVCLLGLSGSARAQYYFAGKPTYPGTGFDAGFNGTFGVPGTFSTSGTVIRSRPAASTPKAIAPQTRAAVPQTSRKMGGLISLIKGQTGKPGSYRDDAASQSTRERPKP